MSKAKKSCEGRAINPRERVFLLKIARQSAEQLPDFPLRDNSEGYFIACDWTARLRHRDFVAAEKRPGEWKIGIVETRYPQKAKRVRVGFGNVAGVIEDHVSLVRARLAPVTGYHVTLRPTLK